MPDLPNLHALATMLLTGVALYLFTKERLLLELTSLGLLVVLVVGFAIFPFEEFDPTDLFYGFAHEALIAVCALMVLGQGLVRTGAAGAAAATGAAALGSAAAAGGTTTAGSGAAAQDEDEVAEAGADTFDDGDEDGAPVTKRGDEDARCPNSVASTYDDLEAVVEATAPKTAGAAAAVADRAEELRYSAPAEAAAEEEEEEVVAAVPSVPALPEGAALEQKRVEVWWGADARWYAGTITRFTRTTGVHHIYYDDGQRAQLDLSDLQQTPCRLVYK